METHPFAVVHKLVHTLKNNVGQEEMLRATLLKSLCKLLWDLAWRIGEVANELPVCTGQKEDEHDIDEEEEEVSIETKDVEISTRFLCRR